MTAQASGLARTRASRGRVIVVGTGENTHQLANTLRRLLPRVSESHDLYRAIDDVGSSGAREPVAAVAISARCEGFNAAACFDAFQRIDPTVQLLIIVDHGTEVFVAEALAQGFENSISLPAEPDELRRIFGDLGLIELPRSPRDSSAQHPASSSATSAHAADDARRHDHARVAAAVTHDGHVPSPRNVVEIAIQDAQARISTEPTDSKASRGNVTDAPAHRGRASHAASNEVPHRRAQARGFTMPAQRQRNATPHPEGPPGDLDLVRALLEGGDLHGAALRVLRHHLGTADVRFVSDTRADESDEAELDRRSVRHVRVGMGNDFFGTLISATLDQATLESWAAWLAHWLELESSHSELRRLAWTDELTGAGNRRAFDRMCADVLATALSERRSVSLMCFDIDNFKHYNDAFGHDAGDEVLRETVELVRVCIRRGDHVFRIGGDEFVVLFCDPSPPRSERALNSSDTSHASPKVPGIGAPESVESIAHRFQRAIAELRFASLGAQGPGTVSVSAGVAVFPWEGHDAASLLRLADLRAIESKRAGKNIITFGPVNQDRD